jgi:hypothetical protein
MPVPDFKTYRAILDRARAGHFAFPIKSCADEIKPGTTVIVSDQPVVRNPISDSTYFAAK